MSTSHYTDRLNLSAGRAKPGKAPRLLGEERRRKILKTLESAGRVTIAEIIREFHVSAVTARADLDELAGRGLLSRSHGGAVSRLDPPQERSLHFKDSIHRSEKVRIAAAAVGLIQPRATIILDSGTTTAEIARQIRKRRLAPLTVITNALSVAMELSHTAEISLVMIGGLLRTSSSAFVGPQAELMLRQLHADHLFLGADGLDAVVGASTPDILEAQLNGLMMEVARQVTIVADATKLGRRSLSVIGTLDRIQRVITNAHADAETVAALRARGIEIVFA